MKAKKLVGVAIPVMLLFGCGVSDKTESKETKTEESKSAKEDEKKSSVKKVKVSKEDYTTRVVGLVEEFDTIFKKHNDTIGELFDGKKKKSDVLDSIKELDGVLDKIESIDPPKEYIEEQKNLEKATGYFRESSKIVEEVFTRKSTREKGEKTDKEMVEESEKILKQGDEYWYKAINSLKDKNTKVGDGTVSVKDIKDLDKKAGIDYDAVQKNVIDGTELIGNWGVQTSDGFKPSFILKGGSPKIFEVYNAEEYPKKTNHIEGTWEYDKASLILKLHITKQMSNGVEAEVVQKDIDYKVQNYDRKNLQLFNDKSFNTTRYVKQS
ncbi:DUF3994 domain-containing protein [Bacillus pseudomycoides]|uniref:DUF3994 domain-containing protein n=1 Tax=Bacillus TaxID=1386 RepID=UPI000370D119|nr:MULTISPECIES: DUF3994 domain-containing protein [Bacillus]PDZ73729.1 DUF3994 domain-containing protein [Bacillus pseudomycoides]PEF21508.1 DUF3994 domain-containing protein [Bacillus pseudomycoides]PEO41985.1 DUF3994 domain-containing protein [Bacillus pseudomycoides]PEP51323.1 DUF3994 domain-containing protein [Bacillus pseudomycoides]PFW95709.1 DUF3994 domain-containing protein [Bacillus pseudomycoides]